MDAEVRWFLFLIFAVNLYLCQANVPHRRFEYKYSFKPPYLSQKDGSVPFWTYGGNAIASAESVRLAPSMRSQKGAMWTKGKTSFDWWEVDILFRITGRGRVGADGLAFWFTENHGDYNGDVFGSSDKWKGLGVFFDSFDNDNKHNNPYIMAVVNDGTKEFDHQNDGAAQALNGCLRDFRNKPYPTRARIEYYMNTLTVLFHNGMTSNEQDFEMCLRVENVHLPKNGFFGLSAATGGLADDHDVIHFLTTSLVAPGQALPSPQVPQVSPEEETKLSQEYAEYQRKLEHQKEEYKKEHPGAATKDNEAEFEEWYESDSQRELRQIFSGQSQIYEQVRTLSTKLDEVIGRQERTLSLVSSIQPASVAVPQGAGPGQPTVMIDTIRRHEVDSVISNQNTLIAAARDIKDLLAEISSKTDNAGTGGRGHIQAVGYDTVSVVNEVRDSLKALQRDTEVNTQRLAVQPTCAASCVSPLVLVLVAFVQLILMFLYLLYRDSKEQQYKKFY